MDDPGWANGWSTNRARTVNNNVLEEGEKRRYGSGVLKFFLWVIVDDNLPLVRYSYVLFNNNY